ncbi:hypothetical protein CROQUDRAFT_56620 [Cronartium quercuum f. sp. fusiforme G11]|uniref:Major facilitator superfamily (MFS) profile domain-containing protein n=1 Tax=Cronartium quercuum f. sp. fusiforme G11 TaxID=708437 RepID=A0A9P6NYI1_9BASI|nr:hypothetical protein CROQUDRAFT_56620 [Cronartium quercuum f. sp. fusiforme G11]
MSEGFQLESETFARKKQEKSAFRKLDRRVLPLLSFFTFLIYLDPKNMLNLRLLTGSNFKGIQNTLGLSDLQYTLVVTVKFISCVVTALPWNMLIGRMGGGVLLPLLLIAWGGITLAHAFVTGYEDIIVARVFLGIVEGGIHPGLILYLSTLYTRKQLHLRIALVFSAACISSAVSGLLAYYIIQLEGVLNFRGWSWVFLLEGSLAVILGCVALLFLHSTTAECKFLREDEKEAIASSLKREGRNLEKTNSIPFYHILTAIKSPHVIFICICEFLSCSFMQSITFLQPKVLETLDFPEPYRNLISMPPYLVAIFFMLLTSFVSDRYEARGISVILSGIALLSGFMTSVIFQANYQRCGSLLIEIVGAFSLVPALGAWMANNSEPYARCSSALAFGSVFGNAGAILSIWMVFILGDPDSSILKLIYVGFSTCLMLLASLTWAWVSYQNRFKISNRHVTLAPYRPHKSTTRGEKNYSYIMYLVGWERLGDKHPDFAYSS